MVNRILLVLAMAAAFIGLTAAFAVTGEMLGDWTDAHPRLGLAAWALWNAGLLAIIAGLVIAWRRYRRSERLPN